MVVAQMVLPVLTEKLVGKATPQVMAKAGVTAVREAPPGLFFLVARSVR